MHDMRNGEGREGEENIIIVIKFDLHNNTAAQQTKQYNNTIENNTKTKKTHTH